MLEWWNSLGIIGQIFALIAIPSTLILVAVIVLLTSWIGLAVYYFWARHHLTEWFK